jgi:signal transduction histidine kinase
MIFRYLFAGILLFLLAGTCCNAVPNETAPISQNISSIHDLVAFVNEATVYTKEVGTESALQEFADPNGSFTNGDVYIWAYDFSGVNLAHPYHHDYRGENKLSLTDPDGLHMISKMLDTARNGSGFVSYQYENPVTGIIGPKLAYVKKVDDTCWLGSGIYGDNISVQSTIPETVKDTLESRVHSASTYADEVGIEQALSEFNNQTGKFTNNGSYIFAFDMNGTTLAMPFHQEKIGKNESDLSDVNGISIGGEKLIIAQNGGGFWYYVFDNPDEGNQPEFKISYINPVNNSWVIGTGMYLPEVPVNFSSSDRDRMVSKVHEAATYVKNHGNEDAIREFNDRNGSFSDPDMFIFAFDKKGTQLSNPYLPDLVGLNQFNDQDLYGKYPVRQLIANAENGGGFTYYFVNDTGSYYTPRLKLGYSEMGGDNMIIGSGIFSTN